jgi:hypothetical protein
MYNVIRCPQGVGHWVRNFVVKALHDVKVTGSKPAGKKYPKNPTMLRVCVAQARCIPR